MRTEQDIEASRHEEKLFDEMTKKGGAYADIAYATRLARRGRTEAGLDCTYGPDGEAVFTVQQGLKAACHGREDAAASVILQMKILERLDRQRKISWWTLGIVVVMALKVLG